MTSTSNGPRGLHHLAIKVRDLPRVEPFYRDLLGLAVIKRWPAAEGPGERAIWVDTGDGAFLALEVVASGTTAADDDERAAQPGLHLVALRIAATERAAWEQRLAAAGVAVYQRTAFTLYVRDPEGNRVGLSSYPDSGGGTGP
ncbi:MAG TPA: VOC family protein [Polyangia bacterium]|nr:VOC family protein [Polyangia bacterium]